MNERAALKEARGRGESVYACARMRQFRLMPAPD